jgi:GTPase SAR1 family protein
LSSSWYFQVSVTHIVFRFAQDRFTLDSKHAIGVEFNTKTLEIDGNPVKAQMRNAVGQEPDRAVVSSSYRGAARGLLVYEVSNASSCQLLIKWLDEMQIYAHSKISILSAGKTCGFQSTYFAGRRQS